MSNNIGVDIEFDKWLENEGNERSELDLEGLIALYIGEERSNYIVATKERFKYYNGEEESMAKLRQEFYARSADEVAEDLLGRYIFVKQKDERIIQARLRKIGAYEGATNSSPEGIYYEAGIVFLSTKFGQRLLHISTGKGGKPSCLTLRDADFDIGEKIERIEGPGNLTKSLGITKDNCHLYQNENIYGRKIWIMGEAVSGDIIKRRNGNSENCLGYYYFQYR